MGRVLPLGLNWRCAKDLVRPRYIWSFSLRKTLSVSVLAICIDDHITHTTPVGQQQQQNTRVTTELVAKFSRRSTLGTAERTVLRKIIQSCQGNCRTRPSTIPFKKVTQILREIGKCILKATIFSNKVFDLRLQWLKITFPLRK